MRNALLIIIAILLVCILGFKVRDWRNERQPTQTTVAEVHEEQHEETPEPEPTEWDLHAGQAAEDVLGKDTVLYLKHPIDLKGGDKEFTCCHSELADHTAIITIFFPSKVVGAKKILPQTTPLIVDEVLKGRKIVAGGAMLAKHELTFRVKTPNGNTFEIIYDVGENMKGAADCSHSGKTASTIYLSDLTKMFTVGEYVPNQLDIITVDPDTIQ